SGSTTVSGAYIGQKAASGDAWAFQSTPAQFKFSGATTVTIPANGSVTSDPLTFAYSAANAYIVSIGYSSYSVNYGAGINYGASYGKAGDYANAGTLDPSGYSSLGFAWHGLSAVTLVGAGPSSQTNTWEANVPAQVYRVNLDGTPGTLVSALSAVTAPGNFYWNGGQLFVYGTASPDTLYSDIEASQSSYGIVDSPAQSYITLDGLHVTNANLRGISSSGNNWVIQNCLIDYSGGGPSGYSHGIFLSGSNSVVKNCAFNQINKWGVSVTGNNNLIENNTMTGCWDGKTYAQLGGGSGITTQGAGNTAYANFISGSYHCIDDVGGSQDSTWDYNLCVTWGTNGLDHETGVSGHPVRIYNNTVIHTDGAGWGSGHGIVCQTNGNYADIQNNIVVVNGTQTNVNYEAIAISANSWTGITLNNNDYYLAPGTTGMIGQAGSTQYPTLSGWQAAVNGLVTGNDAQSISVDPRLSNSTYLQPTDFALQSSSPAVNAGVHLGLTNDFFGNPIEGAPDLGAIEYQFMPNPGSLWW
ncbi:MAG: choice-of-anchor Q domain-containing protein, partial [Syntrophobacteraceae bacterium]